MKIRIAEMQTPLALKIGGMKFQDRRKKRLYKLTAEGDYMVEDQIERNPISFKYSLKKKEKIIHMLKVIWKMNL